MKKLYKVDTPLELLEKIRENYFSRKQVTLLTGLTPKQLADLNGKNVLSSDYFIYSESSYYSYEKLLILKLMAKIRASGNYHGFTYVVTAEKFLKEYLNKSLNDKRVVLIGTELYFYDYLNTDNLIALSGKNQGNLTIKGIFDLSELEKELIEDARKNFINSFELKATGYLSDEEIQEIDKYVIK